MIEVARKREIELELQKKQKQPHVQITTVAAKKSKVTDSHSCGQKGLRCNKCEKSHKGVFHASGCCKCGKEGNFSHECKQGMCVCFKCKQVVHFKAKCPPFSIDR